MDREWLENLKISDTVVIRPHNGHPLLSRVERFTKTLIVLENGFRVTKGWGSQPGEYPRYSIIQPTEELIEKIKRYTLINNLVRVKWDNLTTKQLETILLETKAQNNERNR